LKNIDKYRNEKVSAACRILLGSRIRAAKFAPFVDLQLRPLAAWAWLIGSILTEKNYNARKKLRDMCYLYGISA
jgi:hypothetical protein